MTTLTSPQLAALAIGAAACACDLRTRRIPNALTLGAAVAGVAFHLASGGPPAAALSVAGWLVGLGVFLVPFAVGGLGGGDVKLLAALGAWLGPGDTLWLALFAGAAGGVLAFGVALARGYLRRACSNIWLLLTHWRVAGLSALPEISLAGSAGPRLAYALPIFAGLVVTLWLR